MLQQQARASTPIARGDFRLIEQATPEDDSENEDTDTSLDDAALTERDYVRRRLKEELRHEPTEQEIDDWLRQHTEGY